MLSLAFSATDSMAAAAIRGASRSSVRRPTRCHDASARAAARSPRLSADATALAASGKTLDRKQRFQHDRLDDQCEWQGHKPQSLADPDRRWPLRRPAQRPSGGLRTNKGSNLPRVGRRCRATSNADPIQATGWYLFGGSPTARSRTTARTIGARITVFSDHGIASPVLLGRFPAGVGIARAAVAGSPAMRQDHRHARDRVAFDRDRTAVGHGRAARKSGRRRAVRPPAERPSASSAIRSAQMAA